MKNEIDRRFVLSQHSILTKCNDIHLNYQLDIAFHNLIDVRFLIPIWIFDWDWVGEGWKDHVIDRFRYYSKSSVVSMTLGVRIILLDDKHLILINSSSNEISIKSFEQQSTSRFWRKQQFFFAVFISCTANDVFYLWKKSLIELQTIS